MAARQRFELYPLSHGSNGHPWSRLIRSVLYRAAPPWSPSSVVLDAGLTRLRQGLPDGSLACEVSPAQALLLPLLSSARFSSEVAMPVVTVGGTSLLLGFAILSLRPVNLLTTAWNIDFKNSK
ncbi:hypothetical protein EJB05_26366 [Eragrostis curvula]|uniref:Uncharacterized protein n=1 Tax=Eragrostis curvula TaxID=38414 RepID=A0A5J9UKI4_9POAL|nr:hypothetical protein EJB05_26366 [Eragrostis curvula]